jgi:hypothetical protein
VVFEKRDVTKGVSQATHSQPRWPVRCVPRPQPNTLEPIMRCGLGVMQHRRDDTGRPGADCMFIVFEISVYVESGVGRTKVQGFSVDGVVAAEGAICFLSLHGATSAALLPSTRTDLAASTLGCHSGFVSRVKKDTKRG